MQARRHEPRSVTRLIVVYTVTAAWVVLAGTTIESAPRQGPSAAAVISHSTAALEPLRGGGTTGGHVLGRVWRDQNGNAAIEPGEQGVANAWIGVLASDGSLLAHGVTDRNGRYDVVTEVGSEDATVTCIPPAGFHPTTPTRITRVRVPANGTVEGGAFGVDRFQLLTLHAQRALSLAAGDVNEKDWNTRKSRDGRRDVDLVVGADAAGTDQLSVWFNQYDSPTLFTNERTYARSAPNAILSLALGPLEESKPVDERLDVVTGTTLSYAGNFFVWYTRGTAGNEGYLPVTYSRAYRTSDGGDVQAVAAGALTGAHRADILVGTRSPQTGRGTIELWRGDGAPEPTFTRVETHPGTKRDPAELGEVVAIAVRDLDADGVNDLVAGTKTESGGGQIVVLRGIEGGSPSFRLSHVETIADGPVTALCCADWNGDGRVDVVAAIQTGFSSGRIQLWRNASADGGPDSVRLVPGVSIAMPSIPIALASGDLGGSPNADIVVGYRDDAVHYRGGVRIYYMDGGVLPGAAVDPSAGSLTGMVTAAGVNDFNGGARPTLSTGPHRSDIVVGVQTGRTSGALILFIR